MNAIPVTAFPRSFVSYARADHTVDLYAAHVGMGGALTIGIDDDGPLAIVYGEGGGCTLHAKGVAELILIPLRGSVKMATSALANAARAGQVVVGDLDTGISAVGCAHARWVALMGGKTTWARVLDGIGVCSAPGVQLLPARHAANHDLRRHAIALARATSGLELESAANVVIDRVAALQVPLYAAVARCPGRTHARRMNVFLRLQRVREFIADHCDLELDNVALARLANYSPCHFLSTFNQVFQQPPHAYLVDERLRRAHRMLRSGDLAIKEIVRACGFQNRSAFSRTFHQRFGITAKDVRYGCRRAVG